jgi:hypothetical protein
LRRWTAASGKRGLAASMESISSVGEFWWILDLNLRDEDEQTYIKGQLSGPFFTSREIFTQNMWARCFFGPRFDVNTLQLRN